MKLSISLFFLLALLCFAANPIFVNAEKTTDLEVGVVHKLHSRDEFHKLLETDQVILFEFFATWCGHCKALAPILDEVAVELKKRNIPTKIVAIDVEKARDLSQEQQIQGLPTLKILRNKVLSNFEINQRTVADILTGLKKQLNPDVSKLDAASLGSFKEDSDLLVVGHFKDESSENAKLFHQLAATHRDSHDFGTVTDPSLIGMKNPTDSEMIVYRKSDSGVVRHQGKWTLEDLSEFLRSESLPLVGELTDKTFTHYIRANKSILFFFYGDEAQKKEFTPLMQTMANEFQKSFSFGFCDGVKNGYYAKLLALKEKWPGVVAHDLHTQLKWVLNQDQPVEEAMFRNFLKGVVDGTLAPSYKSQENVEVKKGDLYQATANTFADVVIHNDKDVLVEFYAPWCQHCIKLESTLQDLGKKVNSENIIVVQFNAADNDVPMIASAEIQGYPTLKLYKAFDKTNPIDYTKERSLEGFLNFLSETAHHKKELESAARSEL